MHCLANKCHYDQIRILDMDFDNEDTIHISAIKLKSINKLKIQFGQISFLKEGITIILFVVFFKTLESYMSRNLDFVSYFLLLSSRSIIKGYNHTSKTGVIKSQLLIKQKNKSRAYSIFFLK